jgi:N-acetylmuramoyl-L-alanine amidase
MQFTFPKRLPPWLVAVLAVMGIIGLTITFADDNGDGSPDRVTVTVNTQPGDGAPTKTISAPSPLAEKAADVTESDLRQVDPETPGRQLDQAEAQQQRIRETQTPLPTAGASAGFDGCVTRFVRNQSSRGGVRPQVQVLHYTVSGNRPGWDDVNAIVAYFNNSSSQASSHFVIDREGHCAYIVPIEAKAWTQATGNPIAVSYEIINSGSEGSYMDTAGYAKLRDVMRQVSRRTTIPMQRGAIRGCSSTRRGIVQHADGGTCWGGHHDIGPYPVDGVVKILTLAEPTSRLTRYERRIARERCGLRKLVIASEKSSKVRRANLRLSRAARHAVRNQMRRLTRARERGRSWRFHHIGARRHELARVWTGKGC